MVAPCPYATLGIQPGCDDGVIVAVYRQLAKQHHPDAGGNRERFQEIQAAYETLRDPGTRAAYDARLRAEHEARERQAAAEAMRRSAEGRSRTGSEPQGERGEAQWKKVHHMHWFDPTRDWGRFPNSAPKRKARTKTAWRVMSLNAFMMCIIGGAVAAVVAMAKAEHAVRQYQDALEAQGMSPPGPAMLRHVAMWAGAGWISAAACVAWAGRTWKTMPWWAVLATGGTAGGLIAAWEGVHPSIAIAAAGVVAAASGRNIVKPLNRACRRRPK